MNLINNRENKINEKINSVIKDTKNTVTFVVLKEDSGYSATAKLKNNFIATEGDSFEDLKNNCLEALNLAKGKSTKKYHSENLVYKFDIGSFFYFYRVINVKALSERIGMNQSLLSQYINGQKKPSNKQINKILTAVHQIGKELNEVELIQQA